MFKAYINSKLPHLGLDAGYCNCANKVHTLSNITNAVVGLTSHILTDN